MKRYIERYREWISPPDDIYVATRRERIKRNVWMIGSMFIALIPAYTINNLLYGLGILSDVQFVVVGGCVILAALAFDMIYLFPWGIETFDLVIPWQFREHGHRRR